MKILLVADIHSNWVALQAIRESFDVCLCLGDIVDYGTDPVPCLEWVRRHATVAVRGNHDHAVAQLITARKTVGLGRLARDARPLNCRMLNAAERQFLGRLPVTRKVDVDQRRFFLVHATPRDPMDEYLKEDIEGWRSRLNGLEADFVCVGHTHVPFCLEIDGRKVINPGSVGQPRDGDPRASYCIIEDGEVQFRRVEYDIDRAVRQMREVGLPEDSAEFAERFLKSGGRTVAGRDQA